MSNNPMNIHKLLYAVIINLLIANLCFAELKAETFAYESEKIRVEYYDISGGGKVSTINCTYCPSTDFSFSKPPVVMKSGKIYSIQLLVAEQFDVLMATLIIDANTKELLEIRY